MKSPNAKREFYLVVDVIAGVANDAWCFERAADANRFARQLRAERDENDDDVQVFVSVVNDTSITG